MNRRNTFKLIAAGMLAAAGGVVRLSGATTPRGRVSATDPATLRGGETRPILDGKYFAGQAGQAYRAAAEIPDVLDHMYCYCECERSVGHKSLKSCFVDLHGANCDICQEEALMAWRLNREGLSVLQIRRKIDGAFG
jgi:hypothetical protein